MDNCLLPEDIIVTIGTEYINFSDLDTWCKICKLLYEKIKSRLHISYISGNSAVTKEEYYTRIQMVIKYCMNQNKFAKYNIKQLVPLARIVMFRRNKFVAILGDKTHCNINYNYCTTGLGYWNPILTLCFRNFTVLFENDIQYQPDFIRKQLAINYNGIKYFIKQVEIESKNGNKIQFTNDFITMNNGQTCEIMTDCASLALDYFHQN